MTVTVELSKAERALAGFAGVMRQTKNTGRAHADGYGGTGYGIHVEGALGEVAVAKYLNRYWVAVVDDFRALDGDVGARVQVRTNTYTGPDPYLRVYPRDHDDHAFVLVVADDPRYRLVGWAWGGEAKRDEWFSRLRADRPASYHVPSEFLRPVETLDAAVPRSTWAEVAA